MYVLNSQTFISIVNFQKKNIYYPSTTDEMRAADVHALLDA